MHIYTHTLIGLSLNHTVIFQQHWEQGKRITSCFGCQWQILFFFFLLLYSLSTCEWKSSWTFHTTFLAELSVRLVTFEAVLHMVSWSENTSMKIQLWSVVVVSWKVVDESGTCCGVNLQDNDAGWKTWLHPIMHWGMWFYYEKQMRLEWLLVLKESALLLMKLNIGVCKRARQGF